MSLLEVEVFLVFDAPVDSSFDRSVGLLNLPTERLSRRSTSEFNEKPIDGNCVAGILLNKGGIGFWISMV